MKKLFPLLFSFFYLTAVFGLLSCTFKHEADAVTPIDSGIDTVSPTDTASPTDAPGDSVTGDSVTDSATVGAQGDSESDSTIDIPTDDSSEDFESETDTRPVLTLEERVRRCELSASPDECEASSQIVAHVNFECDDCWADCQWVEMHTYSDEETCETEESRGFCTYVGGGEGNEEECHQQIIEGLGQAEGRPVYLTVGDATFVGVAPCWTITGAESELNGCIAYGETTLDANAPEACRCKYEWHPTPGFECDFDGKHACLDSSTQLMWPINGFQYLPSLNIAEAQLTADSCSQLNYSQRYTDWRLATIDEVRSLIRGCETNESDGQCDIGSCTDTACAEADCKSLVIDDYDKDPSLIAYHYEPATECGLGPSYFEEGSCAVCPLLGADSFLHTWLPQELNWGPPTSSVILSATRVTGTDAYWGIDKRTGSPVIVGPEPNGDNTYTIACTRDAGAEK